jgi:pimeloyl-ACP methyl ester carboxylesterase
MPVTKQNLILIPGLVCDDQVWQHQAEFLNDIAEIIIPPVVKSSTMFGLAEEVLAISPETFAVAGFSMGGYVAMEMYRQAPERISRLALLDTTARDDTKVKAE